MSPFVILHIAAGSVAILAGAVAISVRKGARLHRAAGKVFFFAMMAMAVLAIHLALFIPPINATAAAPPRASIAIAVLTLYLVATAWMTVRRAEGQVGLFEKVAFLVAVATAGMLVVFGVLAMRDSTIAAPYFVFASFAAFGAALDLRMILHGGISGAPRIARHLWRMCFALFFAASFFFIGQQTVMPASVRGSPWLFIPGVRSAGVDGLLAAARAVHAVVFARGTMIQCRSSRERRTFRAGREPTSRPATARTLPDSSECSAINSHEDHMHHSRLCALLIDCNTPDIDQAANFWAEALGRPVDPAHPGTRGNYRMLETPPDEAIVQIQRVDHESRVHLDIETDDIPAEIARLERLGARVVDRLERWAVMQAPTGQRFCVVRVQRPGFPKNANRWD